MAVTLQQLKDKAYALLRETESDSSSYDPTLMTELINSAQLRIYAGKVINAFTQDGIRKGGLSFLNVDQFYSNLGKTSLTTDTTVWATTLEADTGNYPTSWALYINGNIVTYTGTTGTEFTGVDGVLFAFPAWTPIYFAFALPSDFLSAIQVIYNHRFKLQMKRYDDVFEDLNKIKITGDLRSDRSVFPTDDFIFLAPFYTIKDKAYFIPFNLNNDGDQILLRYEKKPPALSDNADEVVVPDDEWALNTIPYLAVWEMLFNRGEESRASQLLTFAYGQVKEMYNFYNLADFEDPNGVQYRSSKGKSFNF